MPYGIALKQRFFLFLGSVLSLLLATKEKE